MLDRIITVRVQQVLQMTPEVRALELVHPAGAPLPGYSAGAHIDVELPGGFRRSYSLARASAQARPLSYWIGVKREPAGRGGSAALHTRVAAGDLLAIGTPRNTFALDAQAPHHLLLAGGIGLTPLLAMAQQLSRHLSLQQSGQAAPASGQPDAAGGFTLAVFARSAAHVAFADDLEALNAGAAPGAPRVRFHLDEPASAPKLDIAALLREAPAGSHLYLCGPAGFMRAVLDAAAQAGWPDERVHLEYFAPPDSAADTGSDEPFVLHLARRGIDVPVAADQSAVDALHDLGIDVPTSCEQGVCGTCVVGWLADGSGEPAHRDHCLSATERAAKVALCCSRARTGRLVIDL